MNDFNRAEKIVSMRKFAGKLDSRAGAVMRTLQEANAGGLRKLTGEMLDQADDILFDLANKAESNAAQQLYFDAMRNVRLQRTAIEAGFANAMAEVFVRFAAGKPIGNAETEQLAEELSLSLVDEEDMEEQVALKNMSAKAERDCYHELFELTVRLASLTRRNELDETAHPFYPGVVARAFADALTPMDMDIKVRLILYKLFEKHVLSHERELLKEANRLLVREGILPKIRHRVRKSPAGVGAPGSYGAGPVGSAPLSGSEFFDDQLAPVSPGAVTGGYMLGGGGAGNAGGFAGFVPQTSNLVGALSALQGYVVEHGYPQDLSPEQVGAQLVQLSRRIGASTGADSNHEQTIGMVSMVFDYILDDADVPDRVKALIARLQIPLLKVALLDPEFFSRRRHPARVLLNEIASAAVGIDPDRDRDGESFLSMLERIVDRVLTDFEDDPKLFDALLTEFRDWREQDQERARVFEDRARKTTEGRERVEFAKRRTEAWVEMWASRDNIPPFIADFLRTTWKNTLLITMHRHGEESRQWANRIKTVNNLLWSITPKKTTQGGRLLVEMIPSILEEVREGMELGSAHPETIEVFFRELAKLHAKTVNGGVEREISDDVTPESSDDAEIVDVEAKARELRESGGLYERDVADLLAADVDEIVLESPDVDSEPAHQERDRFLEEAESLACGTWVQFSAEDGGSVRAKLSWRSPLTGCCLFVDRKGIKVADKTPSGLAAELRSGRAVVLDEVPLLDRAINALMDRSDSSTPPPAEV